MKSSSTNGFIAGIFFNIKTKEFSFVINEELLEDLFQNPETRKLFYRKEKDIFSTSKEVLTYQVELKGLLAELEERFTSIIEKDLKQNLVKKSFHTRRE